MAGRYDLAPDFRRLPRLKLPENRMLLRVVNRLIRSQRLGFSHAPDIAVGSRRAGGRQGDGCPVIEFRPDSSSSGPSAALVYLHGGGFFATFTRQHLRLCERLARELACRVFLPDYRLSVDHPFPAGFNDCYAVLSWLIDNADALMVDSSRIVVGGDSAGAALAAGIAQKATDQGLSLCGQFLIHPVIDHRMTTASVQAFVDTPIWSSATNRTMWRLYLRDTAYARTGGREPVPPYAVPIDRGDFSGLPPTFIEVAEFDPLRDEGLAYAEALRSAGVEVEQCIARRAPHWYDLVPASLITRAMQDRRIAAIRRFLEA
jgi:acetyl esterase/lipase